MSQSQTFATYPYRGNVSLHLQPWAEAIPCAVAVAAPIGRAWNRQRRYARRTFSELEADVASVASGLQALGATPGMRLALLVKPSVEFITLVFGMLRAGITIILIDPGMGRKHMIQCLEDVEPEGFVAIPIAHAMRWLYRRRFPKARLNITVGGSPWGGETFQSLLSTGRRLPPCSINARDDDPAAIIFTTGSTGPPKGVLYTHRIFEQQVFEIQSRYQIRPSEVDLPGFPLFGLFNAAMGVTTVIPEMNPSRPAKLDPRKFVESIGDWRVTQSFGSPAIWHRVATYCEKCHVYLPGIKRILSAGAAVPPSVLARLRERIDPEGQIHTPYGATECLPVASIESREVLTETSHATRKGQGVCVGRRFPGIEWKIIATADGHLEQMSRTQELPQGEIGEIIVRGTVVTRQYVTRTEWNARSKIQDGDTFWHRIGDVGYLDEQDRFWYCGRAAHRVRTAAGTLYTEMCEAIFNEHPDIYRSALIGLGPPGEQRPLIVLEPDPGKYPQTSAERVQLKSQLADLASANEITTGIDTFLLHRSLPVDIRHNAKIFREQLIPWAEKQLQRKGAL